MYIWYLGYGTCAVVAVLEIHINRHIEIYTIFIEFSENETNNKQNKGNLALICKVR